MPNEYTIEQDIQEIINDKCYITEQRLKKISEILDTHYHHREGDMWFNSTDEMIEYLEDNTDYYIYKDFDDVKNFVSNAIGVMVTVRLNGDTVAEL